MVTLLIVLLVLMLLGAIPRWPHSRNWGYGPSGALTLVVVILLLLVVAGFLLFERLYGALLFLIEADRNRLTHIADCNTV